ncbi:MAG: tetratricopeptide repeat protein [Rubricoccaceae bacterium]|nr:tetratricopeptide repeat protein [Rubricoccaceae bacterium]
MRTLVALCLLVLTAPAWLAACTSAGPAEPAASPFLNVVEGVEYVGDETCAQCHAELYESYQTHGMAQSFYRLTPENAVEDFSGVVLHHAASDFYYTPYREGDRFVQEEYRLGPGGEKTHRLVRSMDYVVGSGSAARTYLTREGERLYELPLTWYTQADGGRGRWDFSPGYEEGNARFSRTIPPRCMACHNGTSDPIASVDGAYAHVADGIGCEQCHGPGALHVEARLADPDAADSVDNTIVNPAHLPLDRRLDVCQQCHTNGTVSVLREGEEAFGFRPGERLDEYVAIYALAEDDPSRIGVISHAERMMQSACFVASAAMDCVTCHNPHEGFRDAGPEYFNATCRSCHATEPLQAAMPTPALQAQHAPGQNCFSCHMPKVEAEDAPHASFTDHYIRVVRDDRLEGAAVAGAEATLDPYFEKDEEGAEAAVYEGMAYVIYGRNEGGRDAMTRGVRLLAEAVSEQPAFGEAQFLLGFARLHLGQVGDAIPSLEEAVRLGPEIPERLNTLAQAYERARRDPAQIAELYRRALQAQPRAAEIRVNYGRLLETQGQLPAALAEYERAAAEDPWLAEAHYNRGTALLRTGRPDEGEAALNEAVRLQPDHADALQNLGVLYAQRGAFDAALRSFQQAVNAAPRNPNALANLALTHAQVGQVRQAREYAQQALAVQPGHPTAQQVLAALAGG